ncbi:MAG: hypothetical protein R2729_21945 [Bryobacteraceae bacterium]
MATLQTALPTAPSPFDIAPSLATLDILDSGRASSRSQGFFGQLRAEVELVGIASRLLRDAMVAGDVGAASIALDECSAKAGGMDSSMLRVLCGTRITPLDCEDLKGLSRGMRKIVHALASAGHALDVTAVPPNRWVPVQEQVLRVAEELSGAVAALTEQRDISAASKSVWIERRSLQQRARETQLAVARGITDVAAYLANDAVSRRYGLVALRFRDVNRRLRKAKLKNG